MKSLTILKSFSRKIALVLLTMSVVLACKKTVTLPQKEMDQVEEKKQQNVQFKEEIKVEVLKTYIGQLNRLDTSRIKYNEITGMFSIDGVDQISREKLTDFYKVLPVVNYKNGFLNSH